ncbi:MAG: SDR family oxidoreductase [Rhodothermales bacterium]
MLLQDKVAVITGGNSGIGLATAKRFAAEGAKVAIFGRNQERLDAAASEIGEGTLTVQGDVTKIADLDRLYETVEAQLGKVDVLVANAGLGRLAPVGQMDEATFDLISDVNFKGAFFTVNQAVNAFNDGATIVLIGSVASVKGMPGFSVYGATKAAVRALVRGLAAELAPRSIRVNSLSPGPIATPFFQNTGLPTEVINEMGPQIQSQVPLNRFGQPEEMANVALFLASDQSSYLTGTEIEADGGMVQV